MNVFRILKRNQKRTLGVEGCVWFQCHAHCKWEVTMVLTIGLLHSVGAFGRLEDGTNHLDACSSTQRGKFKEML